MNSINILDISQFQSKNIEQGFYANSLSAHIRDNKSLITKPHKHNSYLYILFTKGFGKHEIDFNTYDVKPGSCFMIAPGQTHHWKLSEDCDGYILTHSRDFYDLHYIHNRMQQFPFFQSVHNLPFVNFNTNSLLEIVSLAKTVLTEYEAANDFKYQKIISLCDLIYIETSREFQKSNTSQLVNSGSYFQKFQQLEKLIETYFLSEKSAAKYAQLMNITSKHLNRIVKSITGKTTSEVISDRVLLEAKRKIIHSKQSFTQIASDLGYDDYAYFSRLYKNKYNETPSEFLKSYQSL